MAATPSSNLGFQNFFSALLTSDITASDVDIPMDTIPNSSEGFLVIEPDSTTKREVIFYNSKTALKVVCPSAADGRGQDDTTATTHSSGATVIMAPVAGFWEAFQSGLAFTDNVINTSKIKTASEFIFDHVASGCVWSGDSYGLTRAASMTSGVVYIGGKRVTVSAVTARTFTASKDTYIDVDNAGTITYTEATNNAASPALGANSIRLGIIITDATDIQDAGSVNQGQEDKVLPIASSVPYAVTDSLGNLICPRDPNRKILGFRRILSAFATTSSTVQQVTGLTCPVIVPTGRKIRIRFYGQPVNDTTSNYEVISLWDGAVGGTKIAELSFLAAAGTATAAGFIEAIATPATASKTYNVGLKNSNNVNGVQIQGAADNPAFIIVELA